MSQTNFVYNPQQQYLFNRVWSVAVGPIGQAAAAKYTGLRVRFDIDKLSLGTSNKAKIEIYNLSTQSRQNFKKGYGVQLMAGYNGLFDTIFTGNILNPKSTREGPDIITCIECGDGEASIIFSTLDKSYPAGVTLVQILTDVAKAMSVGAGVALGIPNVVFNKGFVATGTCADTLNKLLKGQNLEWHIQNGNLNVIPITSFNGQPAVVLSSATGMIGVPSDNADYVQFTSLLNAKIFPGALVQLISENTALNGYYKVRRSHFEGDSHDNKWQVSCEGVPINASQNLPAAQGFNYASAVS